MKKTKNILVLTYWPLRNALVSTYTLPYVRIIKKQLPPGSRIWLLTLSPADQQKDPLQEKTRNALLAEGIESIDFAYSRFGMKMLFRFCGIVLRLVSFIRSNQIDILHAWCTPAGALGWVLSVFTGKKLVLDSFEPHAESMVETGTWKKGGLPHRLLFWFEKKQFKRASGVICAAPGMMEYACERYGIRRPEQFVKPACVDLDLFKPEKTGDRESLGLGGDDIVCVYAGKFGGIYLGQESFEFFGGAAQFWPGRFKVLLLTNHSEEEIRIFCSRSRLDPSLVIKRFVPHHEVPRYMNFGDFGICPVKPVPTKKFCSPIKNGEYWALGLPVVITPDISIDSELIRLHQAGAVLENFSAGSIAGVCNTIDTILSDPDHKHRIRGLAAKVRNFEIAENIYRKIYG